MVVSTTINDINRLQRLYTSGFHDPFLDHAVRKIIDHQIARDRADLLENNETLVEFEQQYSLNSEEFWERFQLGQMADTIDFMEWNAFCRMRQRILERLQILQGGESSVRGPPIWLRLN